MKKNNLLREFEKFQKNENIQAEELKKISGGTCIMYSSHSQSDCDRDDMTYTNHGDWVDIDQRHEPTHDSAEM